MGITKGLTARDLDKEIDSLSSVRATLESEISLLEARIEQQRESLRSNARSQKPAKDGGVYVFDEDDQTAAAFDEFFLKEDKDVDRIRDDLLNHSSRKRRFSVLSARLGR